MPATLSARERARLKARAHPLEPVVRIGHAGVTAELVAETDRGLIDHELIKVSIAVADREERVALGDALADVPVNNAAVLLFENDDVLSIPPDAYRQTFETNVFGVIEVCRAFVPAMAHATYGRVVNVSSGAGQLTTMSAYAPAYSMSKAALNAFTRIRAHTYRDSGVLVNAVDPGWVWLSSQRSGMESSTPAARQD